MKTRTWVSCWLICLGSSIALSLPVVRSACGVPPLADVSAGWGVAGLNGWAAFWLNRRAVGTDGRRFLQWGVIANALRLGTLVAILAAYGWWRHGCFSAFALTVVTGAVVFMAGEVTLLHMESMRTESTGKRTERAHEHERH